MVSHELHLAQRQQGASDNRLTTGSRFDVVQNKSYLGRKGVVLVVLNNKAMHDDFMPIRSEDSGEMR